MNIGVTGGVEFNFVSLIKFPLLSLTHEDVRLIGLNPQFNISMYSKIDLKFHFVFWEIGLRTYLFGLTFSPLNLIALVDPYKPTQRYCYQASYESNVAGPIVSKIVLGSTECTFGVIGALTGKSDLCTVVEYIPDLPFLRLDLENNLSFREDYLKLKCMNWYTADYDRLFWDFKTQGPII